MRTRRDDTAERQEEASRQPCDLKLQQTLVVKGQGCDWMTFTGAIYLLKEECFRSVKLQP